MPIDIKINVTLSIEEAALEDAMEEYDELTVGEMVKQVLDKGIAVEDLKVEVTDGPNTLEEYDKLRTS